VTLTEDRIRVLAPGASPREVEYRQFSAVYEEGRGLKSILLLYHPRAENGLFAHDEERTMVLPAVNHHDALLAELMARGRS
jgi:hypothetical protein